MYLHNVDNKKTLENSTHNLESFTGNVIVYRNNKYGFIQYYTSKQIVLICKLFGFKNGELSKDSYESFFRNIGWSTINVEHYFFFEYFICSENETNIQKCSLGKP